MRNGADARQPIALAQGLGLSGGAKATYAEMLLQAARDYPGLPDPRTLSLGEIVFFYNGLRPELIKHTARAAAPAPAPKRRARKPRNHGR